MLEEAAQDRAHLDVLGHAGDAGSQGADAADGRALRRAGPVERVDQLLVDDRVDLPGDEPLPRLPLLVRDLGVDEVDEPRAHRPGCHEQALEPAAGGNPRAG